MWSFDSEKLTYLLDELKKKLALKTEIPSKTSDLINDSNFITKDYVGELTIINIVNNIQRDAYVLVQMIRYQQ